MAVGREACGAALMVASGMMQTGSRTQALWLQQTHWPYYRIQVVSLAAGALLMGVYLLVIQLLGHMQCPRWGQAKWVFLRAACSSVHVVLTLVAVGMGTPMGDIAALSSINAIVAALAGRIFLGEPLQRAHGAGLLCSIVGACLIGLSGVHSLSRSAFLGYPLAVLAGFAQAFQLIFARKSQGLPPQLLSLAGLLTVCAVVTVLVAVGLVYDSDLAKVEDYPWQATLNVVTIGAVCLVSTTCTSMGGMMCPAGIGATLLTGASIVSGYGSQTFFFGSKVDALPMTGAALMLASMVIMAMFRVKPSPPHAASCSNETASTDASDLAAATESLDDGTDSLHSFASFISMEFAAASPQAAAVTRRASRRSGGEGASQSVVSSRSCNAPTAKTIGSLVSMAL